MSPEGPSCARALANDLFVLLPLAPRAAIKPIGEPTNPNFLHLLLSLSPIWDFLVVVAHLHPARLQSRLVAEVQQRHQHGHAQAANQNVEDSRHVAQAQRACLVLSEGTWAG